MRASSFYLLAGTLLAAAVAAVAQPVGDRWKDHLRPQPVPYAALDEVAPDDGGGMGPECFTGGSATRLGQPVFEIRAGVGECVTLDGQRVQQIPANILRRKKQAVTHPVVGPIIEDAAANRIGGASRDLTDPAYVKTAVTCTRTAPGMRGNDVNGATRCTATGDGGTVVVQVAHANFAGTVTTCGSGYVKAFALDGGLLVTYDGGFTDITASVASSWRRVARNVTINYETAILVPTLCAPSGNDVTFGFKFAKAGDAVDFDFWQVETNDIMDLGGGRAVSTSPIELVDATPIARHNDVVEILLPDAGFSNLSGCVGYSIDWGDPADRYACPQLSTTNDGGFFAYFDIPPNFWLYDGINNPGPLNDHVAPGVPVSVENGWSVDSGTMFGDNSNGNSLSSPYAGKMLGGGALLVIGSQAQIPGNPCWVNGVMTNIKVGSMPRNCHW